MKRTTGLGAGLALVALTGASVFGQQRSLALVKYACGHELKRDREEIARHYQDLGVHPIDAGAILAGDLNVIESTKRCPKCLADARKTPTPYYHSYCRSRTRVKIDLGGHRQRASKSHRRAARKRMAGRLR